MCMKKLPFCKINVRLYLYIYIYPISTKNFYKRHLYVLKGLDVGTKLIWPYAANKEESDRYCWQQSPSVTWHYSPIRTDPDPERLHGYGGALLVASGIHLCMVMVW
jgi:hypothetical protein